MKKVYNKKGKKHSGLFSTAVKIFLFPLFIFGMLLREYDRIFKRKKFKKRSQVMWYLK